MATQSNLSDEMSDSGNQAAKLGVIFGEIAKSAIITLDTEPVNKAMNVPVGKFVRLNDVRAIMQKFINDSLAVR